jgi:hypothetical protein
MSVPSFTILLSRSAPPPTSSSSPAPDRVNSPSKLPRPPSPNLSSPPLYLSLPPIFPLPPPTSPRPRNSRRPRRLQHHHEHQQRLLSSLRPFRADASSGRLSKRRFALSRCPRRVENWFLARERMDCCRGRRRSSINARKCELHEEAIESTRRRCLRIGDGWERAHRFEKSRACAVPTVSFVLNEIVPPQAPKYFSQATTIGRAST